MSVSVCCLESTRITRHMKALGALLAWVRQTMLHSRTQLNGCTSVCMLEAEMCSVDKSITYLKPLLQHCRCKCTYAKVFDK